MSNTVKQKAVHQIRLRSTKKNGEANVIAPGTIFDCPAEDLEWLQKQGACVDVAEESVAAPKTKAKPAAKAKAAAAKAKAAAPKKTEAPKTDEGDGGEGEGDGDGDGDGDEDVL